MTLDLFTLADTIGIIAFAFSGILVAEGKKIDPVGVFVLAFVTAFGGGIVRDILIDKRPFYWSSHVELIWAVILMATFAPFFLRKFNKYFPYSVFVWSDAIGLAFFAASGTAMSLDAGLSALPSIMLGVCTGVFGGLLRDVFINKLPSVLYDQQPYALAAFLGGWIYVVMQLLQVNRDLSIIACAVFIIGMRMICWYKKWHIVKYFYSIWE